MMDQERTVYKQLGGMEAFQRIAAAFYQRVETDDILRPMYPEDLEAACNRLALFLAQFFGGPADYSAQRGHPRLRLRHMPFTIGQAERDRWLIHMLASLDEAGIVEPARSVMAQYFDATSTFLINQPPINQPPINQPPINQPLIDQPSIHSIPIHSSVGHDLHKIAETG